MDKPLVFLKKWSDQILDPPDPVRGPDIDLNDAITGARIARAVVKFADEEERRSGWGFKKLEDMLHEELLKT